MRLEPHRFAVMSAAVVLTVVFPVVVMILLQSSRC